MVVGDGAFYWFIVLIGYISGFLVSGTLRIGRAGSRCVTGLVLHLQFKVDL